MVALTYPGVYIEEIPSGVHTITGVATSVTAFIGRALRGPADDSVVINSFGDFERIFGGLWTESNLGYAVRDFYLNGGSQAVVVRLFHEDGVTDSPAKLSVGGLSLVAASEGAWGANLRASIDVVVSEEVAKSLGLDAKDLFNLTVWENAPGGAVEIFLNVTTKSRSRRIDKVLAGESKLVGWDAKCSLPLAVTVVYTDKQKLRDDVTEKKAALDAAPTAAEITEAKAAVEKAETQRKGAADRLSGVDAKYEALKFQDAIASVTDARKAASNDLAVKIVGAKDGAVAKTKEELKKVTAKYDVELKTAEGILDQNQSAWANAPAGEKSEKEGAVDSATASMLLAKQTYERLLNATEALGEVLKSLETAKSEAEKTPQKTLLAVEAILNAEASLKLAQAEAAASRRPYSEDLDLAQNAVAEATKQLKDLHEKRSRAEDDLKDAEQRLKDAPKNGEAYDTVTAVEVELKKERKNLTQAQIAKPEDAGKITAARNTVEGLENALKEAKTDAANRVSDGGPLEAGDFIGLGTETAKRGLYALEKADIFNLLCIPPYLETQDIDVLLVTAAASYCEKRRAMLIVDSRADWNDKTEASNGFTDPSDKVGTRSANAALFFPRLRQPNPMRGNQMETFAACGTVAGVIARTDAQRGVWKAPAGLQATLTGVPQLEVPLTDLENGDLNQLGINCLRAMPAAGRVVWGARTLQGNDRLASEWKYIPVRRTALFIEESLYRGLQWAVFEPNDEPLWSRIWQNVDAFMRVLFRKGAFQGAMPSEAYFVQCDRDTNPQENIDLGIVTVRVGFAPLKPAEFVVVQISQKAGQTA